MKKLLSLLSLVVMMTLTLFLTSCSMKDTLLILNWGEYINQDVVDRFERETGKTVIVSIADSNELFYSKVKSGTTVYDIVVPSDYMVQKMADNNMLQEFDFTRLKNYNPENFLPGVKNIIDGMNVEKDYSNYFIPYFWGTFGLMYNKRIEGLEDTVNEYGWRAYFENDILDDSKTRIGMYNVPRFCYASTMFYLDESPNQFSDESLNKFKSVLSQRKFYSWGNDTLKKGVQAGNLDLAYMYTGDFLDMLYATVDTVDKLENIQFGLYIPERTIAFMDTLVLTKNARHVDLAYQFIDYMLEDENAYDNASVVGYCTPYTSVYDSIVDGINSSDEWLQVWGTVNKLYYPKDKIMGTQLNYFNETELKSLSNIINNAKVS